MDVKVSCEVKLSKGGKCKEEEKTVGINNKRMYYSQKEKTVGINIKTMYYCQNCNYKSNDSSNMRRHVRGLHSKDLYKCEICSAEFKWVTSLKKHMQNSHSQMRNESQNNQFGKQRVVKHNEEMNVREENEKIESVLNRVKIDFERKRELGKIAMTMIEKYNLNVNRMPKEVKNATIFNLKMDGRG